jgi:outer membrane receptor protein involved in Fe transport
MTHPHLTAMTRALLAASVLAGAPALHAQQAPRLDLEAPSVEVIGTTPLPGLGLPVNEVPSNVQAVTSKENQETQSVNLPQILQQALPSVSVNEIQGNPYQPNVNYRGFTASPLLGEPQGLSVFQDGVRINEPFGDVVSWDLVPNAAISTINLVPGSNPLFGLNTLGGALSVRTKSGRYYPNTELQAYGGSWGRWSVQAEHGGYTENNKDYYFAGTWFEEDGWRDFSPSKVGQLFGKIGHQTDTTDLDLSLTLGDTDLTGNGVAPESMLDQRREQVFTVPDNTRNEMAMLNLSGSHRLSEQNLLSGLVYYRANRTNTLNGDANDDFEDGPNDGAAGANGGLGFNAETGVNNRTRTKQTSYGLGLQFSNLTERNRLTLGASLDKSRSDFTQSSAEGVLDADRRVVTTEDDELENSLYGTTQTWSVFASDTFTLTPKLFLTVSARFNSPRVKTDDRITPTPPNLDGDFTYDKLNPAVGVNYNISPAVETYAGWSQGNRAPSPIELGCADPANPCTLPNALASDPFLEQVVAQTFELGARGRLASGLQWSAAGFRTQNKDDILFVSSSTSAGYFTNFGKTLRQGVELGLSGQWRQLTWGANYAWIDATFRSDACLLSENNSTRGTSTACPSDDEIRVESGDRIPGIPQHQLNLNLSFAVTPKLSIGAGILAYSDQYARGNENNQHRAGTFTDRFGDTRTFLGSGKADGYALLNLTARYRFTPRWEVFARVDNVFDERYATGAILAENPFNAAGAFQTNSEDWARETFFAPGAPRAGWIGVRYIIDRRPL